MDLNKVINLGHNGEQPLMCWPSELSDGFEPHGQFTPRVRHALHADSVPGVAGCTRVAAAGWVPGGYYTGYYPATRFKAYGSGPGSASGSASGPVSGPPSG